MELNVSVLLIGGSWSRSWYFLSTFFLWIQMLHPSLLKAALKMAFLAGLDRSLFMLLVELEAENQRVIGPEKVNKRSLLPETPSQ